MSDDVGIWKDVGGLLLPAAAAREKNTGKWTKEEHSLFLRGLDRHGRRGRWKEIASIVGTRTGRQVRQHAQTYFERLDGAADDAPEAPVGSCDGGAASENTGKWTAEEHSLFLRGLDRHGRGRWREIACLIGTRNFIQVKTHALTYFQKLHEATDEAPEEAKPAGGGGHGGATSENTGKWTAEEHNLFLRGLEEHGRGCWKEIASIVGTRNFKQVGKHAQTYFQKLDSGTDDTPEAQPAGGGGGGTASENTGKWTEEEHNLFLHGLDRHGRGRWMEIASIVRTRNAIQVRQHANFYFKRLDGAANDAPETPAGSGTTGENNTGKWTEEEHGLFLRGLSQHGRGRWKEMVPLIGTRTAKQIRAHADTYFQNLDCAATDDAPEYAPPAGGGGAAAAVATATSETTDRWSEEEHSLFLRGLEENGSGKWKEIASLIGTRSAEQIRTHAETYFRRLLATKAGQIDGEGRGDVTERAPALDTASASAPAPTSARTDARARARERDARKKVGPTTKGVDMATTAADGWRRPPSPPRPTVLEMIGHRGDHRPLTGDDDDSDSPNDKPAGDDEDPVHGTKTRRMWPRRVRSRPNPAPHPTETTSTVDPSRCDPPPPTSSSSSSAPTGDEAAEASSAHSSSTSNTTNTDPLARPPLVNAITGEGGGDGVEETVRMLNSVPTSSRRGRLVGLTNGQFSGRCGTVVGGGNGYVMVRLMIEEGGDGGGSPLFHRGRAADLRLLDATTSDESGGDDQPSRTTCAAAAPLHLDDEAGPRVTKEGGEGGAVVVPDGTGGIKGKNGVVGPPPSRADGSNVVHGDVAGPGGVGHGYVADEPEAPAGSGTTGENNTGRWTEEEHWLFLQGLEEHGKGKRKDIASLVGTRSAKQIGLHGRSYFQKLDGTADDAPEAPAGVGAGGACSQNNTGKWTEEEQELFLRGIDRLGRGKWKEIASLIGTRTAIQVKTHAETYFRRLAKAGQIGEGEDVTDPSLDTASASTPASLRTDDRARELDAKKKGGPKEGVETMTAAAGGATAADAGGGDPSSLNQRTILEMMIGHHRDRPGSTTVGNDDPATTPSEPARDEDPADGKKTRRRWPRRERGTGRLNRRRHPATSSALTGDETAEASSDHSSSLSSTAKKTDSLAPPPPSNAIDGIGDGGRPEETVRMLNSIPISSRRGRIVGVTNGQFSGRCGTVVGWGNGWVTVRLQGDEGGPTVHHRRRAFDLMLLEATTPGENGRHRAGKQPSQSAAAAPPHSDETGQPVTDRDGEAAVEPGPGTGVEENDGGGRPSSEAESRSSVCGDGTLGRGIGDDSAGEVTGLAVGRDESTAGVVSAVTTSSPAETAPAQIPTSTASGSSRKRARRVGSCGGTADVKEDPAGGDGATSENTGHWTAEEHGLFLRGLEEHGRGKWREIASLIRTRNAIQVGRHAHFHFKRLDDGAAEAPEESPATRDHNTGLWTEEEHVLFLRGLEKHGKGGMKEIATLVGTRTLVQVRQHARFYFKRLAKAGQNGERGDVSDLTPALDTASASIPASARTVARAWEGEATKKVGRTDEVEMSMRVGNSTAPRNQPTISEMTISHCRDHRHPGTTVGNDDLATTTLSEPAGDDEDPADGKKTRRRRRTRRERGTGRPSRADETAEASSHSRSPPPTDDDGIDGSGGGLDETERMMLDSVPKSSRVGRLVGLTNGQYSGRCGTVVVGGGNGWVMVRLEMEEDGGGEDGDGGSSPVFHRRRAAELRLLEVTTTSGMNGDHHRAGDRPDHQSTVAAAALHCDEIGPPVMEDGDEGGAVVAMPGGAVVDIGKTNGIGPTSSSEAAGSGVRHGDGTGPGIGDDSAGEVSGVVPARSAMAGAASSVAMTAPAPPAESGVRAKRTRIRSDDDFRVEGCSVTDAKVTTRGEAPLGDADADDGDGGGEARPGDDSTSPTVVVAALGGGTRRTPRAATSSSSEPSRAGGGPSHPSRKRPRVGLGRRAVGRGVGPEAAAAGATSSAGAGPSVDGDDADADDDERGVGGAGPRDAMLDSVPKSSRAGRFVGVTHGTFSGRCGTVVAGGGNGWVMVRLEMEDGGGSPVFHRRRATELRLLEVTTSDENGGHDRADHSTAAAPPHSDEAGGPTVTRDGDEGAVVVVPGGTLGIGAKTGGGEPSSVTTDPRPDDGGGGGGGLDGTGDCGRMLDSVPRSSWVGRLVGVTNGPHSGGFGRVVKWRYGWVTVELLEGDGDDGPTRHNRRAADLRLLTVTTAGDDDDRAGSVTVDGDGGGAIIDVVAVGGTPTPRGRGPSSAASGIGNGGHAADPHTDAVAVADAPAARHLDDEIGPPPVTDEDGDKAVVGVVEGKDDGDGPPPSHATTGAVVHGEGAGRGIVVDDDDDDSSTEGGTRWTCKALARAAMAAGAVTKSSSSPPAARARVEGTTTSARTPKASGSCRKRARRVEIGDDGGGDVRAGGGEAGGVVVAAEATGSDASGRGVDDGDGDGEGARDGRVKTSSSEKVEAIGPSGRSRKRPRGKVGAPPAATVGATTRPPVGAELSVSVGGDDAGDGDEDEGGVSSVCPHNDATTVTEATPPPAPAPGTARRTSRSDRPTAGETVTADVRVDADDGGRRGEGPVFEEATQKPTTTTAAPDHERKKKRRTRRTRPAVASAPATTGAEMSTGGGADVHDEGGGGGDAPPDLASTTAAAPSGPKRPTRRGRSAVVAAALSKATGSEATVTTGAGDADEGAAATVTAPAPARGGTTRRTTQSRRGTAVDRTAKVGVQRAAASPVVDVADRGNGDDSVVRPGEDPSVASDAIAVTDPDPDPDRGGGTRVTGGRNPTTAARPEGTDGAEKPRTLPPSSKSASASASVTTAAALPGPIAAGRDLTVDVDGGGGQELRGGGEDGDVRFPDDDDGEEVFKLTDEALTAARAIRESIVRSAELRMPTDTDDLSTILGGRDGSPRGAHQHPHVYLAACGYVRSSKDGSLVEGRKVGGDDDDEVTLDVFYNPCYNLRREPEVGKPTDGCGDAGTAGGEVTTRTEEEALGRREVALHPANDVGGVGRGKTAGGDGRPAADDDRGDDDDAVSLVENPPPPPPSPPVPNSPAEVTCGGSGGGGLGDAPPAAEGGGGGARHRHASTSTAMTAEGEEVVDVRVSAAGGAHADATTSDGGENDSSAARPAAGSATTGRDDPSSRGITSGSGDLVADGRKMQREEAGEEAKAKVDGSMEVNDGGRVGGGEEVVDVRGEAVAAGELLAGGASDERRGPAPAVSGDTGEEGGVDFSSTSSSPPPSTGPAREENVAVEGNNQRPVDEGGCGRKGRDDDAEDGKEEYASSSSSSSSSFFPPAPEARGGRDGLGRARRRRRLLTPPQAADVEDGDGFCDEEGGRGHHHLLGRGGRSPSPPSPRRRSRSGLHFRSFSFDQGDLEPSLGAGGKDEWYFRSKLADDSAGNDHPHPRCPRRGRRLLRLELVDGEEEEMGGGGEANREKGERGTQLSTRASSGDGFKGTTDGVDEAKVTNEMTTSASTDDVAVAVSTSSDDSSRECCSKGSTEEGGPTEKTSRDDLGAGASPPFGATAVMCSLQSCGTAAAAVVAPATAATTDGTIATTRRKHGETHDGRRPPPPVHQSPSVPPPIHLCVVADDTTTAATTVCDDSYEARRDLSRQRPTTTTAPGSAKHVQEGGTDLDDVDDRGGPTVVDNTPGRSSTACVSRRDDESFPNSDAKTKSRTKSHPPCGGATGDGGGGEVPSSPRASSMAYSKDGSSIEAGVSATSVDGNDEESRHKHLTADLAMTSPPALARENEVTLGTRRVDAKEADVTNRHGSIPRKEEVEGGSGDGGITAPATTAPPGQNEDGAQQSAGGDHEQKTKSSNPGDSICDVCFAPEEGDCTDYPFVKCRSCSLLVHYDCYFGGAEPTKKRRRRKTRWGQRRTGRRKRGGGKRTDDATARGCRGGRSHPMPQVDEGGLFTCDVCRTLDERSPTSTPGGGDGTKSAFVASSSSSPGSKLNGPEVEAVCDGRSYANVTRPGKRRRRRESSSDDDDAEDTSVFCQLCRRSDVAGALKLTAERDGRWVHLLCMMSTYDAYMDGNMVAGVPDVLKRNAVMLEAAKKQDGEDIRCEACLQSGGLLLPCASRYDSFRAGGVGNLRESVFLGDDNKGHSSSKPPPSSSPRPPQCHAFLHPLCAEISHRTRVSHTFDSSHGGLSYKCASCSRSDGGDKDDGDDVNDAAADKDTIAGSAGTSLTRQMTTIAKGSGPVKTTDFRISVACQEVISSISCTSEEIHQSPRRVGSLHVSKLSSCTSQNESSSPVIHVAGVLSGAQRMLQAVELASFLSMAQEAIKGHHSAKAHRVSSDCPCARPSGWYSKTIPSSSFISSTSEVVRPSTMESSSLAAFPSPSTLSRDSGEVDNGSRPPHDATTDDTICFEADLADVTKRIYGNGSNVLVRFDAPSTTDQNSFRPPAKLSTGATKDSTTCMRLRGGALIDILPLLLAVIVDERHHHVHCVASMQNRRTSTRSLHLHAAYISRVLGQARRFVLDNVSDFVKSGFFSKSVCMDSSQNRHRNGFIDGTEAPPNLSGTKEKDTEMISRASQFLVRLLIVGEGRSPTAGSSTKGSSHFYENEQRNAEGRVTGSEKKKKLTKNDNIQLFADDFMSTEKPVNAAADPLPRSKRLLKSVQRYEATFGSHRESELGVKIGEGFSCPSCKSECSYYARMCLSCGLLCRYVAGVGVQVYKDRNHLSDVVPLQASGEKCIAGEGTAKKADSAVPRKSKYEADSKIAEGKPFQSRNTRAAHRAPAGEASKCGGSPEFLECEKCYAIVSEGHLHPHRRRQHGLKTQEVGCPFCNGVFASWQGRNMHILYKHIGARIDTRDQNTLALGEQAFEAQPCPYCSNNEKQYLAKRDLQAHIDDSHKNEADCKSDMWIRCPLCVHNNEFTRGSLKQHIFQRHRCHRIAEKDGKRRRLEIHCEITRQNHRVAPKTSDSSRPNGGGCKPAQTQQPKELRPITAKKQKLPSDCWTPLKFERKDPHQLASVLAEMTSKLEGLEKKIRKKPTSFDDFDSKDYIEENKLFGKGLQIRKLKARNEQADMYVFSRERREMMLLNLRQKQGKKRTKEDIEFDAFCSRPVRYVSGKKRHSSNCDCNSSLCNGEYAKVVVTESELKEAGGDIQKVLPVTDSCVRIAKPLFSKVALDSMSDSEDETDEFLECKEAIRGGSGTLSGGTIANKRSRSRVSSSYNELRNDWMSLNERINTARFVEQYNKGLLSHHKDLGPASWTSTALPFITLPKKK